MADNTLNGLGDVNNPAALKQAVIRHHRTLYGYRDSDEMNVPGLVDDVHDIVELRETLVRWWRRVRWVLGTTAFVLVIHALGVPTEKAFSVVVDIAKLFGL